MAPLMTYALPTMQLVCHLMVPEPSNISTTTPAPTQPPTTTPVPTLPNGYVAYPQFGAAYKVSTEQVSWMLANARCIQEGAHLAVIDSLEKIQVVKNQAPSVSRMHVGFQWAGADTDSNLFNIHTGLSVPQSSLPWALGEPNSNGRCVVMKNSENGLGKYSCIDELYNYVCEISYP